ncbi:hypothetical protein ISN44_As02g006400 [Arabidopsis suecica]|uniref:Transmembrane protein n=2 Tax=Arabidopsis TaxID=3701 RepID=B3H4D5_ARATH|nr:uncharacterized protein AT2G10557 [Arabidopsis thaliana]AEC06149.1 transmembrane protein [Arabidopsis thaliana]KAG7640705.1 hypothetical protein ISN44_As02g006390 [Arabidopsis suecica]KAG7640706.1 hypothetical protein ISN44_As02g006400 [Arabidopsis suecica]|eukprot:NP_001118293.1 transmembrane protein [Arabidopsis thaliana]
MFNLTTPNFPLPPNHSHTPALVVLFGVMATCSFLIVVVAAVCYCLDHREQTRPCVEQ